MNTALGALIAALIALVTAALALLAGEGVEEISDISTVQWLIVLGGGLLTFLKDFQAISARRALNRVTGTGDGGGHV